MNGAESSRNYIKGRAERIRKGKEKQKLSRKKQKDAEISRRKHK